MPLTEEARKRLQDQLKQNRVNSRGKPRTKISRESYTRSTRKQRAFEDKILEKAY